MGDKRHRKQKKNKIEVSPNLFVLEQFNQRLYYEVLDAIRSNEITLEELQELIVHYTGMYANHKELVRNQLFVFQDGIDPLTNQPLSVFNYHHIIKDEYGGSFNFQNGILLNKPSHEFLHNQIELHDKSTFDLLTDCLLLYKDVKLLHDEKLLNQWNNEVSREFQKILRMKR